MLPGFRFLLAAITLSISMLVFGLGAAALLRAAHEQFASNPSWHAAPEATFAQQAEPAPPVLALLHAEPAPVELKTPDNVAVLNPPPTTPPVEQAAKVATAAAAAAISPAAPEQAAVAPASSEPEKIAALKPEQTPTSDATTPAKPAVADDPSPSLPTAAQNGASGSAANATASGTASSSSQSDNTPAPTKQAALAPAGPQANEAAGSETGAEIAPAEPTSVETHEAAASVAGETAPPEMDAISTKLAALDSRPLMVQPKPRPKAAIARAEQAAKKRLARQAALRRKLAAQARQAALTPPPLFPPFPEQLNQPPGPSLAPNH